MRSSLHFSILTPSSAFSLLTPDGAGSTSTGASFAEKSSSVPKFSIEEVLQLEQIEEISLR